MGRRRKNSGRPITGETSKSCKTGSGTANHSRDGFPVIKSTEDTSLLLSCDPLLAMLFGEDAQSGASLITPTDASQTVAKVGMAVQSLGTLESDILAALYPSNGSEPESLEAIAARLGMSVDEVQNIADNALRGLRGNGFSRSSTAWN